MEPTYVYNHIRTTNDANGNPRRLFHVHELTPAHLHHPAREHAIIEEGYDGTARLLERFGVYKRNPDTGELRLHKAPQLLAVYNVTPSEYNALKRRAKAQGIYHG